MLRACSGLWSGFSSGGFSSSICLTQVLMPTGLSSTSSLLAPLPSAINVITQRWKYRARKPPGAPRSRKKRYYTRVPTPRIPEEMAELFWRYSHYRTEMRALREHFAQWKMENHPAEALPINTIVSNVQSSPASVNVIDEEFAEAIRLNNELNDRNAAKRNARREQEMEYRLTERRDILIQKQNEEFEEQEKYEDLIERKKEVVANLITPENFNERLENAMDNPVDFNFCIGLNGRMTRGRPDPLNKINMHFVPKDELSQTPQENPRDDQDPLDRPNVSATV